MSDLRVQKCDNCHNWNRPEKLAHVTVVESTGYVSSLNQQTMPIMQDVVQQWCVTCRDAIASLPA